MNLPKILYSIEDAADALSVSPSTIRRAIRATDPAAYPGPLRAKRDGKGRYLIPAAELQRWADGLADA